MIRNKHTGSEITREALLRAIGDGGTSAEIRARGGWEHEDWMRAVDGALQRERRAGMIRFKVGTPSRWQPVKGG